MGPTPTLTAHLYRRTELDRFLNCGAHGFNGFSFRRNLGAGLITSKAPTIKATTATITRVNIILLSRALPLAARKPFSFLTCGHLYRRTELQDLTSGVGSCHELNVQYAVVFTLFRDVQLGCTAPEQSKVVVAVVRHREVSRKHRAGRAHDLVVQGQGMSCSRGVFITDVDIDIFVSHGEGIRSSDRLILPLQRNTSRDRLELLTECPHRIRRGLVSMWHCW